MSEGPKRTPDVVREPASRPRPGVSVVRMKRLRVFHFRPATVT